jgi:hypothetical protein
LCLVTQLIECEVLDPLRCPLHTSFLPLLLNAGTLQSSGRSWARQCRKSCDLSPGYAQLTALVCLGWTHPHHWSGMNGKDLITVIQAPSGSPQPARKRSTAIPPYRGTLCRSQYSCAGFNRRGSRHFQRLPQQTKAQDFVVPDQVAGFLWCRSPFDRP